MHQEGDMLLEVEPGLASPPSPLPVRAAPRPQPVAATASAESQLSTLAASVGPLRRVLAAIASQLLATKAHERLCFARLGDYARERVGLSARQLQDLARVHGALAGLPRLEHALVTNELPWSKVRLIARVASAADEEAWIARARRVPTRRIEHEVREHGRGGESSDREDEGPRVRVTVHCTPALRAKWELTHEIAERVAGGRLPAGAVLELVAAETFSCLSVDERTRDDDAVTVAAQRRGAASGADGVAPAEGGRAPARPLLRSVAALAAGLAEADAFELDRRLRAAVRLEQTLDAAIAPLLRVVASGEHEWCGAYRPLAAYAPDALGMSASKARTLLRLERAGDACPELREAYRSGRLSWVKAQCLLPLLLLDVPGEWRRVWVAWAERVTVRRLEADVARALLLRAGTHTAWQRCKLHPELAQDPVPGDEQLCAQEIDTEATERLEWRVPYDVAGLFAGVRAALCAQLRAENGRALRDGEVFGALLDHALLTWTLREPGARRPDPVIERDGYRCAVPGCTSRRSLHDHHVTFRSAGGSHAPENRVTLCAFHHQRCLHAGLLRVRGHAPDALVFELGVRRGAPPLARYGSGDVALPAIEGPRRADLSRSAA
jgi:hypothetical protein